MSDLDEILSSGRESAPVEATSTEQQEQTTEEHSQAPAEQEGERSEGGKVPVAALQKEREKEREKASKRYTEQVADFERRLAETNQAWERRFETLLSRVAPQEQPPAPPDYFEAPEAAIDHRVARVVHPLQQALVSQQEGISRLMASEKHGEQAVNEAYQALAARQGRADFEPLYRQIMSSPHPYGALVDWHKKEQALSKFGNDPEAFIEAEVTRRLAEKMAEIGEPPAQNRQAMPSNFATARNVGSRSGPAWSGPPSLADIFATRK